MARRMLCRSRMSDDRVNGEMVDYLTRADLREELEIRDRRFDAIDQRFDSFEQRMIHSVGRAILTVNESMTRQIERLRVDLNEDVGRQMRASHEQLRVELRQDIAASEERLRTEFRGLDDQYRDLPERVERLEDHVGIKR